ncbi:MAG: TonB-dependent receptor [Verrucomicrobia bacterium]|nr:TonB-dependent receptor [Verrucomicrobiota bacterium]
MPSFISRRLGALLPHRIRWLVTRTVLLLAVILPAPLAFGGTVAGTVSSLATGNLLEGARVEVPKLGRTALTDNTGHFLLADLPAGEHELVVSYTGLDAARKTVRVEATGAVAASFDLSSGIYKLEAFTVAGTREGSALAITAQRNADNVKNVVAMDSFGNLPNMSAGELAIRLPGVAGNLDDEGNVTGLTVRGMGPTLNRVTVDGGLITNVGGLNRQFQTHSLTGAMFEQLEVIKGHTPDKGADSLGGTINLKTRSPLSMKEKRRTTYSVSGRWAPSFTQQIPLRRDHPSHPLFNLAHQEVFDVLGGQHNLGVSLNMFYSENVAGYFRTIRDFENTTAQPAYLWDYRTQDAFNNRKQGSLNLKADYRFSPTTKFSLNTIYNDAFEPFNRLYETRAFTNQTAPNTTTSGVIPGYTNRLTNVRPVAASVIDVTETMFSFFNRTRQVDFGGEHNLSRLQVDYNANYSQTHNNLGVGNGGTLTNRIAGIGWMLDRTQSDLYPRFLQTAGSDITNPANYRPNGQLTTRNNDRDVEIRNVRGNVKYNLPTEVPVALKAGFDWREQKVREVSRARRWNYLGTTALPADPSIVTWASRKSGWNIPQWESAAFIKDETPVTPARWGEDRYYREQQRYTGTRQVTETVAAGYAMAQGKVSRLGWIAGVRSEKTEDASWGWVRAHSGSTTAQQTADPVGSAQRDYANTKRVIDGSYTKSFPSAHLTYDVTPSVKGRLSWSTSFGRPAMANLVPGETFNDTARTLTVSNPSLRPQTSTNWDATLDYYFEPVGNLSVGWFRKQIKDYIVSGVNAGTVATGAANGYDGEYGGYTLLTTSNAGTAFVQGWELSYQQRLTFLPNLLKTLTLAANYTKLDTHGDFGGATQLTGGQVANFIPRTGNVDLSWSYRGFTSRVRVNYTGDYIAAYTATSIGRNQYRFARTITDLSFAYQVRPSLTLMLDVANLFNEPTAFYRGIADQMERTIINGTTITVGLQGRF